MAKRDPITVFTDGACLGNPGPGGWAWAVPGGAFASGPAADTTNQRMEILAAYEAIVANGEDSPQQPIEVVSDSTYVVNCFRDRWFEGWKRRGWLNSQRKPVANRDLWEPLVDLVGDRGDVTFRWVKGHSGQAMNELVDRLALEAAQTQRGRSGTEPPELVDLPDRARRARRGGKVDRSGEGSDVGDVEAGDVASSGSATGSPGSSRGPTAVGNKSVEGHGMLVLGAKPPELGGYDDNSVSRAVRQRLASIFDAKAVLHPDLVVVTGLRLGAEMLGGEAAVDAGVPFVVVLPYPDPEKVWPSERQRQFRRLLARATDTILLQKRSPESKQKAAAAMRRRDAWLARNSTEAVLVWDGRDELLGKLHRSLEQHLGDDVWIVNPDELAAST